MADLLLDTHVLLWWEDESAQLSDQARRAISDPSSRVFVSAASVWEAGMKARKGKLELKGSLVAAIAANGFHGLPVTTVDAEEAGMLDWVHPDPFDRVLVAQALRNNLVLITSDRLIRLYPRLPQIWASA